MRISDWSSDVCSSDLGYLADLAREQRDGDTVFEQDGVRIFVDADRLALVDGTRIDFLKQGLNEQFVFENPNVAAECGCGESFTTKTDRAAQSGTKPRHQDQVASVGAEARPRTPHPVQ